MMTAMLCKGVGRKRWFSFNCKKASRILYSLMRNGFKVTTGYVNQKNLRLGTEKLNRYFGDN